MRQRIRFGRFPAGNPVANALMAIVGALAVGAAIVFGFFVFILVAGLFLLLAGVVGIRIWWVGRKLRKLNESAAKRSRPASDGTVGVIEGEYHVVKSRRPGEREPHKR